MLFELTSCACLAPLLSSELTDEELKQQQQEEKAEKRDVPATCVECRVTQQKLDQLIKLLNRQVEPAPTGGTAGTEGRQTKGGKDGEEKVTRI